MKRIRIFARIAPFWNPCIFARDVHIIEEFAWLSALEQVSRHVPQITYRFAETSMSSDFGPNVFQSNGKGER